MNTGEIKGPSHEIGRSNNDIWQQLADLFNFSFMPGVLPSVLKTEKVVPVFKKDSKLGYSNYRPIFPLSNIE